VVCPGCADQLRSGQQSQHPPSLGRAFLYGAGAAFGGFVLYAAVSILTGLEIGLIAIVVGAMVGKAVRHGSNGSGGRPQQIIAVILTYFAISTSYLPVLFYHIAKNPQMAQQRRAKKQAAQAGSAAGSAPSATGSGASLAGSPATATGSAASAAGSAASATGSPATATGSAASTPDAAASPNAPTTSPLRAGHGLGFAVLALLFLAVAAPFLALGSGVSGLITLFIVFIGLQRAWKLTAKREITIMGPYEATPAQ
jgi:hypothetical protein